MPDRDLVVIGGSLGSIEPLKAILRALPPDFPAAILIVVHVPTTSTGVFATVSAASSVLPVKTAEDGLDRKRPRLSCAAEPALLVDGGR